MDAIDALDDLALDGTTKGIPFAEGTIRLGDVAARGWNVVRGDLALPAMTLRDSAVASNIALMRDIAAQHGISLAPHAKTTGAPQLYRMMLKDGGAWGFTAATVQQALLAARTGAANVLLANQLAAPANVAHFTGLMKAFPRTKFMALVDSVDGARLLATWATPHLDGRKLGVLIEMGPVGGRAGARTLGEAKAVIAAITASPELQLVGVEAYEGGVKAPTPEGVWAGIDRLLDLMLAVFDHGRQTGAFAAGEEIILSAGSSTSFDQTIRRFGHLAKDRGVRIVVRGGAFLALDHGFYRRRALDMDKRGKLALPGGRTGSAADFKPGLELWAAVQSLPDPRVAILGMGMRDLPYDIELPIPLQRFRGGRLAEELGPSWKMTRSNDQHCYVEYPDGADIRVGDILSFGISHTSTAFDKWDVVWRIADDFTVTGAVKTFF
jgi:D-serine dehydratase